MQFTPEQTLAIERRRGELLLDAGAGSGKTSVLVERFVRAVEEDGIGVNQILTITFTEKAAAELRERIRTRLRAVRRRSGRARDRGLRGSRRSTHSARGCCAPMHSRPASIRSSSCSMSRTRPSCGGPPSTLRSALSPALKRAPS